MAVNNVQRSAYGFRQGLENIFPAPILANRAPTVNDKAPIGRLWIYPAGNDAWVLTSIVANVANWSNLGGGAVDFNSIDVATTGTFGTTLTAGTGITATTGNIVATAGAVNAGTTMTAGTGFTVTAGTTTVNSNTNGAGAIQLHTNGGTAETILLRAQLGTGTASVNVLSDVGGVTVTGGFAGTAIRLNANNAAGGINAVSGTTGIILGTTGPLTSVSQMASQIGTTGAGIDMSITSAAGSVNIVAAEAATDAVLISASSATGGIVLDSGVVPGIRITNGTQTAQLLIGTGSPNAAVTGLQGSLYIRTDGAAATTLYVNTDGAQAWSALS